MEEIKAIIKLDEVTKRDLTPDDIQNSFPDFIVRQEEIEGVEVITISQEVKQ